MTQPFTATEMMTVAAARLLRDRTVCFVGIGLPSTAANLARLNHAPDIVLIYESGPIGAKPVVLPLSIAGGVWAAYKRDSWIDRLIVNIGVALSSLPEFVVGVLFLVLLAVPIEFFRVVADPPRGSGVFTQMQYLLLPALTVLTVYFGYIARITRASTITALDADYTRTAFMRGLSTGQVFRKHVLRNSLLPTVAVVGTQLGYLFGGMVGLELIYNYPGLGRMIFDAVDAADYPLLRGGVLTVTLIYMFATLAADLVIAWMNPRARLSLSEAA